MDYESMLERFYTRLDLTGGVAIDVGAHVGRHTVPLARQLGVGGLLYAFEPLPHIRSTLVFNLLAADLNNVVVCPFALSKERGIAEFNYIPNLPEESGLKKRHVYNAVPAEFVKLQVGVFTLDGLIAHPADTRFIKIDVQGGELDVLEGAAKSIEAARPVVAFECGAASFLGYHDRPDRIFELFQQLNYKVWSITGLQMTSVQEFAKATQAQTFWDYVALPAERIELAAALGADA